MTTHSKIKLPVNDELSRMRAARVQLYQQRIADLAEINGSIFDDPLPTHCNLSEAAMLEEFSKISERIGE